MSVRGASAAALRNGVKISKTGVDAVYSHGSSLSPDSFHNRSDGLYPSIYICTTVIKRKALNH